MLMFEKKQLLNSTHIDIPNNNTISIGIKKIFSFRIAAKYQRLTSLRTRQSGKYILWNEVVTHKINEIWGGGGERDKKK